MEEPLKVLAGAALLFILVGMLRAFAELGMEDSVLVVSIMMALYIGPGLFFFLIFFIIFADWPLIVRNVIRYLYRKIKTIKGIDIKQALLISSIFIVSSAFFGYLFIIWDRHVDWSDLHGAWR